MNDWQLELDRLLALKNEHANAVASLVREGNLDGAIKRAKQWGLLAEAVRQHLEAGKR